MGLRLVGEEEREPEKAPHHTGRYAKKKKKRDPHAKRKEDLKRTGESDLLVRLTMHEGLHTKMCHIVEHNKGKGQEPRSLNKLALVAIMNYVESNYDVPESIADPEPEHWEEDV